MNIDHSTLLLPYADAQAALARVEERRRLSPVRRSWKVRSFIAERQALAWIDATMIDASDFKVDGRGAINGGAFDLTHWRQAVGAPITLDTMLKDSRGLLRWLGVDDAPSLPLDDIERRVHGWQQAIATLPPAPPLLQGSQLSFTWRQRSPIGKGDSVASFLIGDRHGPGRLDSSFGGIVALGFQIGGMAWKIADQSRFDRMWLDAIVLGARHHLDQELRLRNYAMRATAHIASRRRPGRLKEVVVMAMSNPQITSRQVADRLGITSAGAIKLLTIAADAGLLVERSGQSSYRSYAIPVHMSPSPSLPSSYEFDMDDLDGSMEILSSPEPR